LPVADLPAERRIVGLAVRGVTGAGRSLGPLRRPLAEALGSGWYALRSPIDKNRVAANFRRLLPTLSAAGAERLARASFREYVAMMSDVLWAEPLPSQAIARRLHVIGGAHVQPGAPHGVLVISHFGNWDMAASGALALGVRLATVMAPFGSAFTTAMLEFSRARKGMELYTPQHAALGLVRALRHGKWVGLMADVPEAGPTVLVPYCGGLVRFSAVPARLAAVTGTPMIPVSCWREGARWVLHIQPPIEVARDADEAAAMSKVAAALEPAVRRHPEQWYPFHDVYAD
jgi:lauroyl/myristoyl acyltransferase